MGVRIGRSLLGLEAEEPVRKGFVTTEERAGRGESSKVYRDIKSGLPFFFFLAAEHDLSWPEARPEWFLCTWNQSVLDLCSKCRGFSNWKCRGLLPSTNCEDSQVLTLPSRHLIHWLKIIMASGQIWGNAVGLSSYKTEIGLRRSCILPRKWQDFLSHDMHLFTLEINMC